MKKIIQIKLTGMPMIFHFTRFHSSNCCGSRLVSKNMLTVNFNRPPCSYIRFFLSKSGVIESCLYSERPISIQSCMVPRWIMKILHSLQKFERPPFWNNWSYGIKIMALRSSSMA
jgi:hypothetical protein